MQKTFKEPNIISVMKGKISRITDGDTYTLTTEDGQDFILRLWNFDTPEKDQDLGQEITDYVTKLLKDRDVEFEFIKIGKYERNIGRVFVNEKHNKNDNKRIDISLHLAFKGYGYTSSKIQDDPYLIRQKEAAYNKRGVWANKNSILPSDHRQQAKKPSEEVNQSVAPKPKVKVSKNDFKEIKSDPKKKPGFKKRKLFD